ncbi:diguanylate cyclase [Erythrobacter sp. sf7]|uniref:diguanylate cyclase n=1 Tax=Erythrobacter fulvus TaxID=2987523 RepID=A0ABT5JS52_9SPHN|nr:GGDEF domain-containing protein [Erythrobacter fulvus]MDC8755493.1 diguanylate cyclase [Erythrobacter fulvus]
MSRVRLALLMWMAAALMALGLAAPASAGTPKRAAISALCHAASGPDRTTEAMIERAAWNCTGAGWQADAPVAWLRFEADAWRDASLPRHFVTRAARHERITFYALDAGGTLRGRNFDESDGTPFAAGPVFRLPLPVLTSETEALLVRIDRPHSIPMLTEAVLVHDLDEAGRSLEEMMLLTLVLGMLVLPLLFDISFYLVLRERFVLFHAAMVVSMMGYVLFAGGVISSVVTLPVAVMAVMAPLWWSSGCGAALLFLSTFLEGGALSRGMRRLTFWAGCWTIAVPGFFALQLHATQAFDDAGYFLAIMPSAVVVSAALIHAILRGSRSAKFVGVAWFPLILTSMERLIRGLGVYAGPSSLDLMMFVATGIEVIVISLAIADRFLAIRIERDAALTEARMLEQISTRDSLTGLMNRRAIEARFDALLAQGFDTFALVDLDRFKAINDLHGHQVGDAALVACANAIRMAGDRDSVAVRLGGEEFVVLLRGERTLERAEALRQAIPRRIAQDVPGLDLPVTASMGVIVLAQATRHAMQFSEFYARADALMYEAKASGRNRLAYERLTVFSQPPAPRRTRESKAA